jgi:hypothetical protein
VKKLKILGESKKIGRGVQISGRTGLSSLGRTVNPALLSASIFITASFVKLYNLV